VTAPATHRLRDIASPGGVAGLRREIAALGGIAARPPGPATRFTSRPSASGRVAARSPEISARPGRAGS
jgi:hypothetical protein